MKPSTHLGFMFSVETGIGSWISLNFSVGFLIYKASKNPIHSLRTKTAFNFTTNDKGV
jgi:hypothetical protein